MHRPPTKPAYPAPKKLGRQRGFLLILGLGSLLVLVAFVLYTWLTLSFTYSSGERAGYMQKLSYKGWLCKTWEGELAMVNIPGTLTEKFYFSVRDDSLAKKLNSLVGKKVALEYEQHIGVPSSCFGETEYFIVAVREVPN